MPRAETTQHLVDLGFNGLEAEVYAFLLREAPATGYRVARAIGKPAANTYKAIEALVEKGAALVDEGESRRYRAVRPEELLSRLERSFHEKSSRALAALRKVNRESVDDRVYQLRSAEQVLERARRMLARARRVALLDLFPGVADALRPEIAAAAARGVAVAVKAYRPLALRGATVVVHAGEPDIVARWPGEWLNAVVDGSEHLLALLAPGGKAVHHAIWSGGAYVSWVYHCALVSEIFFAEIETKIAEGAPAVALKKTLSSYRRHMASDAPGYRTLVARFAVGEEEQEKKKNNKKSEGGRPS